MLSDDQVRTLWNEYYETNPWPEWHASYVKALSGLRAKTDEELATTAGQQLLWTARDVATLGPGDSINTQSAYAEKEIVSRILRLRHRPLPENTEQRGHELQAEFDWLLAEVRKHTRVRPNLKLLRIFAIQLPAEMHIACNWPSSHRVSELMLDGDESQPMLVQHVRFRARLRALLGPERADDLEEHVRRAIFAWWLYDREIKEEPAEASLVIWPYAKQMRGMPAVKGTSDALLDVLRHAVAGVPADDLVEEMKQDPSYATLSARSCRWVIRRVQTLGLLARQDGLFVPTAEGLELLDGGEPNVLVERFVERVFGFSHLLDILRKDDAGLSRGAINEALRYVYPRWTTNFMPGSLLAWADSMGLVTRSGHLYLLSDYGKHWAGRLPERLPLPPPDAPDSVPDPQDDPEEEGAVPDRARSSSGKPAFAAPTFDELFARFSVDQEASRYVFPADHLRALHAALHTSPRKRFVLLTGLSGTGKTQLARLYARLYCEACQVDADSHRAVVPVSPDWRDPAGLLGYFNPLHDDPTFQAEPALRLVLRAADHPAEPFFLILDEMNLARVEHHFAPFLSAMETGDPLMLHANEEPVNAVPPSIPWPCNVFVAGTVNMDETTHPFSDKVLDRAFTLEFWQVDLAKFFTRRRGHGEAAPWLADAERILVAMHDLLAPVRRHFGYRTAGEVLGFVEAWMPGLAADQLQTGWRRALDQALLAKVLPHLRGEESKEMEQSLQALQGVCETDQLPCCAQKLNTMRLRLRQSGIVGFFA